MHFFHLDLIKVFALLIHEAKKPFLEIGAPLSSRIVFGSIDCIRDLVITTGPWLSSFAS